MLTGSHERVGQLTPAPATYSERVTREEKEEEVGVEEEEEEEVQTEEYSRS